jgi:hypothetical protein
MALRRLWSSRPYLLLAYYLSTRVYIVRRSTKSILPPFVAIMASSGAAEKDKFHDGALKPYPHEELGRPGDVSTCLSRGSIDRWMDGSHLVECRFTHCVLLLLLLLDWTRQGSRQILVGYRTTSTRTSSGLRDGPIVARGCDRMLSPGRRQSLRQLPRGVGEVLQLDKEEGYGTTSSQLEEY